MVEAKSQRLISAVKPLFRCSD
ncbi:MAG: hypothetical protein ACYTXA_05415 [Nostoc sp.]